MSSWPEICSERYDTTTIYIYTVAFDEAYYACSNLDKTNAARWYVNSLWPNIIAFICTQFPSSLSSVDHSAV